MGQHVLLLDSHCHAQSGAYVVVQFFPLAQFFLNWYRIHWTGTIVIVLVYFHQLSKKRIFLFLGCSLKNRGLVFLGGLKKNMIFLSSLQLSYPSLLLSYPSLLLSYPSLIFPPILKNFLFTHLNLNLNPYLWICCPLSYQLDHTSSSYLLAMIIYN